MKKFLNKILNVGIKPDYQIWEIHLTRKLNSIALITFFNMISAILFLEISGHTPFVIDCVFGAIAACLVLVVNSLKNYVWATYWFFGYGFWFFIPINLKMGLDSFIILFYFPVIISMVQVLGRKEMFKHLIVLCGVCLLSIVVIMVGFKLQLYKVYLSDQATGNLRIFHILLCFITTLGFVTVMLAESQSQEKLINKMLVEKEILLAEVFHRVKNNMNIVTSLLNLKKNMSDSDEVKVALEECRGRVFSMALVHDNIFNKNNITGLNFKDYVNNLVNEIANAFGEDKNVEITLETDDVNLELSYAIPCGLILNELVTNSFKYAQTESEKLQIRVKLKKNKNIIELEVKDNGKGFSHTVIKNKGTLGLELIDSLTQQIGGTHSFINDNGLVFKLQFIPA